MRLLFVLMVLFAALLPQAAGAGDAALFHGFRTLRPFLHELWFDDYDPDVSGKALSANRIGFACSAVRSGDFHGRNFDFLYTDTPEFIVHVAADPKRGRLASVGVAMHFGLHEGGVTNGQYAASASGIAAYNLLPTAMADGINERGVVISVNSVLAGEAEDGIPGTKDGLKDPVHIACVQRLVLDRATNAQHAVRIIAGLGGRLYGTTCETSVLHYLVSDPRETLAVEIVKGRVVARHIGLMTNFNLNWNPATREPIDDSCAGWSAKDYWLPPQNRALTDDERSRLARTYAPHAEGIERFAVLRDGCVAAGASVQAMADLLRSVRYTRLYDEKAVPQRITDLVSEETTVFDLYPTSAAKLAENREYFRSEILPELDSIRDGVRDPALDIWITVHSAVYDIPNRTLRIVAQEDFDHPFVVRLR